MLAKTNRALAALETYRQRLEQALARLTALEFQSAVMLDDALVVVQRAEMTTRMVDEIERDCVELGSEGRLTRGYRALSHIPRLPAGVIKRVVAGLDGLDAIVRAGQRELESVEGVGAVRAREIHEGLRRLQEHNLVDRYLNL